MAPKSKAMKTTTKAMKAAKPVSNKRKNDAKDDGPAAKRAKKEVVVEKPKKSEKKAAKKPVEQHVQDIAQVCAQFEEHAKSDEAMPVDTCCQLITDVMGKFTEKRTAMENAFVQTIVDMGFATIKTKLQADCDEKKAVLDTCTADFDAKDELKGAATQKFEADEATEAEKRDVDCERDSTHEEAIAAKTAAEEAQASIRSEGESNGAFLETCTSNFALLTAYEECTPPTDKQTKKEVKEFLNFLKKRCDMDNTLHTAFIVALEVYPREGFNQIVWKQVQEFTNTFRAKIEANIENQPTREQDAEAKVAECQAAIDTAKAALDIATEEHTAAKDTTKESKQALKEATAAADEASTTLEEADNENVMAEATQGTFDEAMVKFAGLQVRTGILPEVVAPEVVEEPVEEAVAPDECNDVEMAPEAADAEVAEEAAAAVEEEAAEAVVEEEVAVVEEAAEVAVEEEAFEAVAEQAAPMEAVEAEEAVYEEAEEEEAVHEEAEEEAVQEEAEEEAVQEEAADSPMEKENAPTPRASDRKMSQEHVEEAVQEPFGEQPVNVQQDGVCGGW